MLSGKPAPLGATFDGAGVNFALTSAIATAVHLCLFDSPSPGAHETTAPLIARTGDVWHGYVPGLHPGQCYGYRVFGPWDPARGRRCNPAKVLFDPYARLVGRAAIIDDQLLGHAPGTDGAGAADTSDSRRVAPLAAVPESGFDWGDDHPPKTPWHRTVIYEAHVKGLTASHPHFRDDVRGTFRALASREVIDHLRRLGVTAVELLPIHAHADEPALVKGGLTNYWGYNTLGFFAVDPRFVPPGAEPIREFKNAVRTLHAAGLEVILDVVFNHTAEGDHLGPTLSFRGIDNPASYRLRADQPALYDDVTGCGSTVDLRSPVIRRLVLDSLRYWIEEFHVDGFRFDLATALLRGDDGVDWSSSFLAEVAADPLIAGVKLIAEPWDATPEGYQTGGFPPGWAEWNDRYRDEIRRFWRGDAGMLPALATRLAGSDDLFGKGRSPLASVNYITSHDGFTLADLVSYNAKHNEANGEENRDGQYDNASWNCGVEGPTDDDEILALRRRQRRNLWLTLAVSQGVPMLNGGDELGRSQLGNNNAYCHDSLLTWTPWTPEADWEFFDFASRAMALRAAQPGLRQTSFLKGRSADRPDVLWLRPEGGEMTTADWNDPDRRSLGMLLDGTAMSTPTSEPADTLLIIFNAASEPVAFTTPTMLSWELVIDTTDPSLPSIPVPDSGAYPVAPRSMVVLKITDSSATRPIRP